MLRRTSQRIDPEVIRAAAVEIAHESGLQAVNCQTIATRLDCAFRAVTASVPDEALVVADLFSAAAARELADVKRAVLAIASPTAQMLELLHCFARAAGTDVDSFWIVAWSLTASNAVLAVAVCVEQAKWHDFIASIIRRGTRFGEFPPVDADQVAGRLLAVMDGVSGYNGAGYRSGETRLSLLEPIMRVELGLVQPPDATFPVAR